MKMSDAEFEEVYYKYNNNQERADATGYSPAYISIKASKLGLNKRPPPKTEPKIVLIKETGTYERSYLAFEGDEEKKVDEVRNLVELNDTEFTLKKVKVFPVTEKELELNKFHVDKLKRHFI